MSGCNDCDPPIPDTLYVTFTGLRGDLGMFEGKNTLRWMSDCWWRSDGGPLGPFVQLIFHMNHWTVGAYVNYTCYKQWIPRMFPLPPEPPHECAPWLINYVKLVCVDDGCSDKDSCEDSEGATCVVSTS